MRSVQGCSLRSCSKSILVFGGFRRGIAAATIRAIIQKPSVALSVKGRRPAVVDWIAFDRTGVCRDVLWNGRRRRLYFGVLPAGLNLLVGNVSGTQEVV